MSIPLLQAHPRTWSCRSRSLRFNRDVRTALFGVYQLDLGTSSPPVWVPDVERPRTAREVIRVIAVGIQLYRVDDVAGRVADLDHTIRHRVSVLIGNTTAELRHCSNLFPRYSASP